MSRYLCSNTKQEEIKSENTRADNAFTGVQVIKKQQEYLVLTAQNELSLVLMKTKLDSSYSQSTSFLALYSQTKPNPALVRKFNLLRLLEVNETKKDRQPLADTYEYRLVFSEEGGCLVVCGFDIRSRFKNPVTKQRF